MASGDVNTAYDKLLTVLKAKGFVITDANKPYTIVADRGSLSLTRKINKFNHSLVIAPRPTNNGLVLSFVYMMSDFWDYTPGDRAFFDSEINAIAYEMASTFQVPEAPKA